MLVMIMVNVNCTQIRDTTLAPKLREENKPRYSLFHQCSQAYYTCSKAARRKPTPAQHVSIITECDQSR